MKTPIPAKDTFLYLDPEAVNLADMIALELPEHEADLRPPEDLILTEEAYLATEPDRFERHEYVDGQIRMMAGASDQHEGVANQLNNLIYTHLRGKPRRVYKGDMKLRIQQRKQAKKTIFYYPDIMVVCDPSDNDPIFKTKPKLVIEVLSTDKGRDLIEKLSVYREIDTLEEYFVISQNASRPEATAFRRRTDFEAEIIQEGDFEMESIGLPLTVKELYQY